VLCFIEGTTRKFSFYFHETESSDAQNGRSQRIQVSAGTDKIHIFTANHVFSPSTKKNYIEVPEDENEFAD
jgi:hypothetical protein